MDSATASRYGDEIMNEFVIGYDARAQPKGSWPKEFLLKSVSSVRSVDKYVWPSCGPGIQFLAEALQPVAEKATLVAITWVDIPAASSDDADYFRGLNAACVPKTLPAAAELIGFDVCDKTLLSGLLDCAYSPEEETLLAPKWAPKLNAVHLFSSAEAAALFVGETAKRVPEHAPFFVFGIYKCGP